MPGAGRLKDHSKCGEDYHGCPGCPHVTEGPAISGSPTVKINGAPALRAGDRGVHAACCKRNVWVALEGSGTVFINGRPLHRETDATRHCGGDGELTKGSGNVIVGGPRTVYREALYSLEIPSVTAECTPSDAAANQQTSTQSPDSELKPAPSPGPAIPNPSPTPTAKQEETSVWRMMTASATDAQRVSDDMADPQAERRIRIASAADAERASDSMTDQHQARKTDPAPSPEPDVNTEGEQHRSEDQSDSLTDSSME